MSQTETEYNFRSNEITMLKDLLNYGGHKVETRLNL